MKTINPDVIPALPISDIIAGECVAIGLLPGGVLIHFMERDAARLIEWDELVRHGLEDVIKPVVVKEVTVREIDEPKPLH